MAVSVMTGITALTVSRTGIGTTELMAASARIARTVLAIPMTAIILMVALAIFGTMPC
ncbi:MAG: hypothetical protein IJ741_08585 [Schwartzia sp.]|nr:hypothetical protein [Schwartzia sp. (in: firmicutes)]